MPMAMATVPVRGVELAVSDTGAGLPLFWGHGLISSMAQEDDFRIVNWPRLAKRYRVVRWDARGHAQSGGATLPDDYHWDNLARDLVALADTLDVDKFVAGGVSMGAATALHAATQAPDRVVALVLALPPTAYETRPGQSDLYRAGAVVIERSGIDAYLEHLGTFPVPEILAEAGDRFRPVPTVPAPLLPSVFRGAAASDLPAPERVRGISSPALLLPWATDPGHPLSTSERLVELLSNVQVHVAHQLRDVATWTDRIEAFLEPIAAETRDA